MIVWWVGNVITSTAEALVNPVNCVGVMGAGLAKQFKDVFPHNYEVYKRSCVVEHLTIGKVLTVEDNNKLIINFPTKLHWKDPSKLEYIAEGLDALVEAIKEEGIKSIAIPMLGCGLGGLDFQDVYPLIVEKLGSLDDVEIRVYMPARVAQ